MSNKFSAKRKENLFKYLKNLPKDIQFFLQVTNRDWYERVEHLALVNFLKKNGIGLVIDDAFDGDSRQDVTVNKCFIRFTPINNTSRLEMWLDKIKKWQNEGMQQAYFFVEEGEAPEYQIESLKYFKNLVTSELSL